MAVNNPNITILNQLSPSYVTEGVVVPNGSVSSIAVGVPTKANGAVNNAVWDGSVSVMVDGDGTTSQRFAGVAVSTSTDTASASGVVNLYLPYPGVLYAAKAKSSAAADTSAEVAALFGKGVFFDLTAGVWTVDTAASAAQANCVMITGGDPNTSTVYFNYKASGTILNGSISA